MPWRSTPEQREQAREWAAKGYTLGMICVRLGFSKNTIRRWIDPELREEHRQYALAYRRRNQPRLNAYSRRYMRGRKQGRCPICEQPTPRVGVRRCRACREDDRKWLRREILVLWNDGASVKAIAAQIGRSPSSVAGHLRRMRDDGWDVAKRPGGRGTPKSRPLSLVAQNEIVKHELLAEAA